MKSDATKGDQLPWKRLPFILLRLCLENRFLFDFIKYETMRAEIHDQLANSYAYVLWDNKLQPPNLKRIGCLGGIIAECVREGSSRRGLAKDSD